METNLGEMLSNSSHQGKRDSSLIQLLNSQDDPEITKKIELLLQEGDNYLHHYARANYSQEINRLSVSLNEEGYFVQACMETNHDGNYPAMVAAMNNNKESLLALLTPILAEDVSLLEKFLHHTNNRGHNIMYLVAHHPGSLFVSWSIIMDLEKRYHDNDPIAIKMCLRKHLGSTYEAHTSVELFDTLQREDKLHYRNKKDSTMGVFPSILYFLYTLCFVIARILSFQMFAYYLGPGNFGMAFIGVFLHIVLFSILHFIFSDSLSQIQTGEDYKYNNVVQKVLIVVYDCIFNGFANIYVHNYIEIFNKKDEMETTMSNISTFLRQCIFDVIFILENLAMILLARETLKESFFEIYDIMSLIIGGFSLIAIILKNYILFLLSYLVRSSCSGG
ncbi:unnamed protein product [Lepeophtheirus salmonis]|uniref:XK-related protein n=1 Tax=Lepeophtheirus salmonis TaxID=72036 RepID=A0A7R8D2T2_LEPSM|nr:unnamed protein product [Lepeophtheirus salmonis]CAF3008540.1 unnamed protein product [Lepeophtheirus salmonis]